MTLIEERPPKKKHQPRPADDVVEPQTEPVEEPVEKAAESSASETKTVQPDIPYSHPDFPTEIPTGEVSAEQAESSSGEQTETEQPESASDGPNE